MDKQAWTPGNWCAYVVVGATKEERSERLLLGTGGVWMRATLIEIQPNPPVNAWYHHLAGRRLWCRAVKAPADDFWLLLPGQGIPEHLDNVIFTDHARLVTEAEVQLVLEKVPD